MIIPTFYGFAANCVVSGEIICEAILDDIFDYDIDYEHIFVCIRTIQCLYKRYILAAVDTVYQFVYHIYFYSPSGISLYNSQVKLFLYRAS